MEKDNEKKYTNILLEEIRSHFKALGEEVSLVKQKGEATFEEVVKLREDITTVKIGIVFIKKEIIEIKNELNKKIDKYEYLELKKRVDKLETYIKRYITKEKVTPTI